MLYIQENNLSINNLIQKFDTRRYIICTYIRTYKYIVTRFLRNWPDIGSSEIGLKA